MINWCLAAGENADLRVGAMTPRIPVGRTIGEIEGWSAVMRLPTRSRSPAGGGVPQLRRFRAVGASRRSRRRTACQFLVLSHRRGLNSQHQARRVERDYA